MSTRTLSLVKGGQKHVFRYCKGSEAEVVNEIMQLAEDKESPLDWLDAATLSFQITHDTTAACHYSLSQTR